MEDKARILIVDHDEDSRTSLALILGQNGCELEVAGTGREAIEKVRANPFNLTLLDLKLPDMEGLDLLEPLWELRPEMAVVMITDDAGQETIIQALNGGVSGYITKPLMMDEVLDRLEEVLERQRSELEHRRFRQEAQRELAERREAEERLIYLATHDALTGLPNRTLLNDRLSLELSHGHRSHQPLAVMLLGLDHFKDVNDTLGHGAGDQLLKLVGRRLTDLLRRSDTIARIGGDEFVLILPAIARVEDADRLAEKVLEAIRKPFVCEGHEFTVTASMGVALFPQDGEHADTLVKHADVAMYRAKAQGRDCHQHYSCDTGWEGADEGRGQRLVAARWQASEAPRGAQLQLQHVLAASPAVIYSCKVGPGDRPEEGYLLTFASQTITKLLGYEVPDVLGDRKWWSEHLHPDDAARAMASMERLFSRGHLVHEYRMRHCDGSYRWVRDDLVLVRGSDGQPVEFVGSLMDITDRKRVERSLDERVKELACLYAVHRDMQDQLSVDDLCRQVVERLVQAMHFPEIAVPVIELDGGRFTSRPVTAEHPQGLHAEITVGDEVRGKLWVTYSEGRPFQIPEEQDLINTVAEALGLWLERQQAQDALRASEEMHRMLLEASPDAVTTTDLEGRITYASHRTLELYGFDRMEELLGRSAFDFIAPEEHDRAMLNLMGVLKEAVRRNIQYTSLRQDGTRFPAELSAALIRDASGQPAAFVAITRDVTERLRAQEALQRSERHFRALTENAPDAIAILDADGTIRYWSPSAERALAYEAVEVVGREALEYIHPEDQARLQNALAQATERPGVPASMVLRCRHRDGSWRTIRTANTSLLGDPAVGGIVVNFRDITDQVRAERLLRTLNETALAMGQALTPEEIFATVDEGLERLGYSCVLFLMDEEHSRLLPRYLSYDPDVLRAAEEQAGLSHKELSIPVESVDTYRETVRDRKAVFAESSEEIVRQVLPESLQQFAGQATEMLKLSKSIVAPLIVEDEVMGMLSVQSAELTPEDVPAITAFAHQMAAAWRKASLLQDLQESLEELEQTQTQLLQAQKMEAVGRLAGGVAHDFNNILTAIMGFGQLLHSQIGHDDPRRVDMEEILKAGRRATSLTRQLLAFSRRQVLQEKVVDLNELAADTEKMLRRVIGEDIQLVTLLEPRLHRVQVDPGQMHQVLMNLAVNARDAMPEGGVLTIRTENVVLEEEEVVLIPQAHPGSFVCLSVTDTGIGMREETLEHIFEPFFTTKGPEEGTGLGLAVVYGIAAQHEGWINVYSEPGRGSTFRMYLPAFTVEEEDESPQEASLPESAGDGEGILLVEDDEGARRSTGRMLRRKGYLVYAAASVEEAVEVFEREEGRIGLVFTDMVLPDGTGLELVERLLTHNGDLPVLLSSGYSDDRSRWSVVRDRGYGFVQKPYSLSALLQAIREAMG